MKEEPGLLVLDEARQRIRIYAWQDFWSSFTPWDRYEREVEFRKAAGLELPTQFWARVKRQLGVSDA